MSTLGDLARARTRLSETDIAWLHALVAEWQLLADLSFADLRLWAPLRSGRADDRPVDVLAEEQGQGFVVLAQMRPTTGPTTLLEDHVGEELWSGPRHTVLQTAWTEGRIVREGDPVWEAELPLRAEAVPVRRGRRIVAVLGRDTSLASARVPSQLELTYLHSAGDLATMTCEGRFPFPGTVSDLETGPRVGDGLVRVDADGLVTYASPNAQSAYRRLGHAGDLSGRELGSLTARLVSGEGVLDDPRVTACLQSGRPHESEVEAGGAVLQLRGIPLLPGGRVSGALVLVRDVTEVRRRDRQLMSKDATIREIHHRVKNNLQTVAALLRLQARRMAVPEARLALEESVRRVTSIALVHETLSLTLDESVRFDEIADRVLSMVGEIAGAGVSVRVRRAGSFGELPAAVATPLAMVLTELLQNAVEHAFDQGSTGGLLEVRVRRREDRLHLVVADDGRGLPRGFRLEDSPRLGLQIVRTLVVGELEGSIALRDRRGGGTEAVLDVPLGERRADG